VLGLEAININVAAEINTQGWLAAAGGQFVNFYQKLYQYTL
jgi:hypothetical protein